MATTSVLLLTTGVMALLAVLLVAAPPAVDAAAGETTATTHIKVYWHDVVAEAAVTNTSKTFFGLVVVIDDPLTDGPELNSSRLLGRAQGTYIAAGKDEGALLMAMNFVFQAGKYNGSTVAIMGRNAVFHAVREMPVVGGTGVFRMARGYVQARTHTFDQNTGDATVEYNLFISH
nr:unnamed protein product [Digitaria exilis]CAB3502601.1 unnamed protein product [Digitaria exilis]